MSGNAIKVIVAEDNSVQRMFFMGLIEKLGYAPISAEDGLQALELLKNSDAQILLSDYQMPNLNGIDLTKKVRKLDLDHYVHIIMVTGSDEDDMRTEALIAGVDDFFTKGSNQAMLKARLRTAARLIHHAAELSERMRIIQEANERIENDLKAASAAQRDLLPDIHTDIAGFRIASAFVPSSFVSGDMFGCFGLDEHTLGFYAVDVAGHGVHASLLSVAIGHLITPEFFRNRALTTGGSPSPSVLVADLNRRFLGSSNDAYFTMFCGVVDNREGQLIYCQAGYPSPLYLPPTGKAQNVGDGGFPVAMFPDVEFEDNALVIDRGGHVVICSDAASEAEDEDYLPYGIIRLEETVAKAVQVGTDGTPVAIIDALTNWRRGQPLEDDLTVVALKRN